KWRTPKWTTRNETYCTVPYKTWVQSSITTRLSIAVTVFAFIQLIIVVILRQRKIISEDAMVSKLGAKKLNISTEKRRWFRP
ncbi:MAG: hypothetical protein AAF388_18485, partial [Bacteroidota bacterium]